MIKTTTKIDKSLQKEFSRKYAIFSSVCLVLGVFGVLMYAFRDSIFNTTSKWTGLFIIFVIPLGVGLLLTFLVIKTKNATTVDPREITYEFSDKGVDVVTTRDGVETLTKIAYADILKTNQTKNFLFIYVEENISYPIDLRNLSKAEIIKVKQLVGFDKKQTNK